MKKAVLFLLSFILVSVPLYAQDESWRTKSPSIKGTIQPVVPRFSRFQLPNGLYVITSQKKQLPIAVAKLVIRAGSAKDPLSQEGLAELTLNLLDESSAGKTSLEVADAFAQLGTSLESTLSQDAASLSVSVLVKNLEKALELMSGVVLEPTLDLGDFDRVKDENISALIASRADPSTLAMEAFWKTAYQSLPAYSHPIKGALDSVSAMTLKDVKTFYDAHYKPENAALILVGDITAAQAKKLARTYFGSWKQPKQKAKEANSLSKSSIKPSKKSEVILIEHNNSPQTVLVVGRPLWDSKRQYQASDILLNEIIAGMFSSRLNTSLRERRAWTYGVQSMLSPLVGPGPFIVYSNIQVPYAPDALEEIFAEFKRLRETGITTQELKLAKDSFIQSFSSRTESLSGIARQATMLYVLNLPMDFYQKLPKRIAQVTQKQVNKAAQTVLQPSAFTTVLVGELDSMEGPVRSLKLGDITVVPAPNT